MLKSNADNVQLLNSDTGSVSQKSSDIVSPEQEYFLYELETSDAGSIGLVLRAIYDGGDQHKFLRALEKKIRHYDKDIEKLCNYHYHGFVDAVHELLDLKTQCRNIKSDIKEIDTYLKENSKFLMEKAREIVKARKTQKNIASAIDNVSLCLPVLEKYSRLQEQMEQKKYYPALKTLEQLEHTYLPRVERYKFAEKMKENIAHYREQIKEASFSEFTDFLENVRMVTKKIGQIALKHARELHSLDNSISISKPPRHTRKKSSSADRTTSALNASARDRALETVDEEEFSAQDMVDFSPVYKCCLIFTVLNAKDSFDVYYRKQRRDQAKLLIETPDKITDKSDWYGNLGAFSSYFHEIVGFFVLEDHIMNTASGLVTRAYRDELWQNVASNVEKTLNNHFGQCTEADVMLAIKDEIIMFALTMKGYGFQVGTLYKVLQNFRDQYNEILMTKRCAEFDNILRTDSYSPVVVNDEDGLHSMYDRFPLAHKSIVRSKDYVDDRYPTRFPFSEFVPAVYEQVKLYIVGCLKFMENLGISQTDVDDTVRRSTNLLFERFSGHLKRYLVDEIKSSSLVQLIQITINMGYLEKSCESLEQYISKTTGATLSGGHVARLKEDMFKDARSEVEQKIDDAMRQKIGDFLSVAQYTWDLSESSGRASGYITDLISFLQTTFISFTNLPPVLARHVCMQACKYLSSRLMQFLMDPDVKQVSTGALEQFNLDVIQCELFTAQCPVPGYDDSTMVMSFADTLVMTFADLRQLLDLFMSSDWSTYLADFGHEHSKYDRVHPNVVTTLLEKMMENERRKNSYFSKSKEKDRRKLLETVLKQLKNLSNGGGHG